MMFQGAKVVVAGGTGLIGSAIAKALAAQGARVVASKHVRPVTVSADHITYRSCDFMRMVDCQELLSDAEYLFICAANTSGAAVMKHDPMQHITPNLIMNANLFEAAVKAGCKRVLFISSSAVYPNSDVAMTEDQGFVADPHPVYFGVAWMKRYFEKLAQFYHNSTATKFCIIRPSNVYGPYDDIDYQTAHVLPALIRKAIEKMDPYEVWGDKNMRRDFIYADDFAHYALLAMEHFAEGKAINIASGKTLSIVEIVDTILSTLSFSPQVRYNNDKPTTIAVRAINTQLAEEKIGLKDFTDFAQGIANTAKWIEEQCKSYT